MSSFIVNFILATFISSIGIAFVLMVKTGLKKHITAKWQYKLDLLFFVLLTVPFIPGRFYSFINWGSRFNTLRLENVAATGAAITTVPEAGLAYGMGWLQDFAVSVEYAAPGYFSMVIAGTWVAGVIVLLLAMLHHNRQLRLIKESVKPVTDAKLLAVFANCKAELGIESNIMLGSSILAKTPMAVGFIKTQIVLPAGKIPLTYARYAMLHELTHYKNMDIKINGIMSLFQVLYWYNPLVYFTFRQMRMDRELACDAYVLEMLPQESHAAYGQTLINFATKQTRPALFSFATGIGGSKPQIMKRIRHISAYTTETVSSKVKNMCVLILVAAIVFCQFPVLSALASSDIRDNRFNFNADNVQYADLSYFFGDINGSFVLYDLTAGMYTIHNRSMSTVRVSPKSTYKIFSALIALETGVLEVGNTTREWDGTIHPFESWNRNHDLASAMGYSANWYFQDMDAQVGIETLEYYLSRLSYGNSNLSGGMDFWQSSLRISPVEQVALLRDLYQNNTLFDPGHVNTVKDSLRLMDRDGTVLSGKTGTGIVNGNFINGWFVGYVENNGHTFIFATYIQCRDNAGGSVAAGVTIAILEDMGIFPRA